MQLSIIIPMFNAEKFIEKLLDSIYIQNSYNVQFELIIVDDASQDNSVSLVRKYIKANKVENLVLVESKNNGGTATARNLGIGICTGNWIQFIDSDDSMVSNYFELVATKLNANIDCYVYGFKLCYSDKIVTYTPQSNIDQRMIGFKNSVVNKIYRKEMIRQFDPSYKFEDVIWLVELIGRKAWRCETIDNLVYNVNRTNEDSKMANINQQEWKKMAIDSIKLSKTLNNESRAFVLETFVGTLFADIFSLRNRVVVTGYALITNYKLLPYTYKKGIRRKINIKKSSL